MTGMPFCQASYEGIEGDDREEMYESHVALSRAVREGKQTEMRSVCLLGSQSFRYVCRGQFTYVVSCIGMFAEPFVDLLQSLFAEWRRSIETSQWMISIEAGCWLKNPQSPAAGCAAVSDPSHLWGTGAFVRRIMSVCIASTQS